MKQLKAWICVECGCIQSSTGQYPKHCRCGGTEFIRDEITIPHGARVGTEETESARPSDSQEPQ